MTMTTDPSNRNDAREPKARQGTGSMRLEELREKAHEKAHETKDVHGHEMPASNIFKFVGLIVFFALMVLAVVLLWPYMHEVFEPGGVEHVTRQVREAGPAGFLILLGIQFIQIVVAFVPGEVVQIAAGLIYGPWLGALIILLGCVISSSVVFLLVHRLGAPFVQAMVPEKYMNKMKAFEESPKLNTIVFVLFLIPGLPKDVFTYLVPLTHMKMHTFVVLSNLARIPGIVISTYAASGLAKGDYAQSAIMFGIMAVIAVIALVVYNVVSKKKEQKK